MLKVFFSIKKKQFGSKRSKAHLDHRSGLDCTFHQSSLNPNFKIFSPVIAIKVNSAQAIDLWSWNTEEHDVLVSMVIVQHKIVSKIAQVKYFNKAINR